MGSGASVTVTTGSAKRSPRSHDTVVLRGAPAVRPTTISGRSTTWETVSADTSSQTSTFVALAVRAAGTDLEPPDELDPPVHAESMRTETTVRARGVPARRRV